MDNLLLAQIIASRLCHDLISPIGALCNGLEVCKSEADKAMQDASMEMIEQSAHSASEKLQFFRIAFGMAGDLADEVSLSEMISLIKKLEDHRTRIELTSSNNKFSKSYVKFIAQFALCGISCLMRGGNITFSTIEGKIIGLTMVIEGHKARLPAEIQEIIEGKTALELIEPRHIHAYLAYIHIKALGLSFRISSIENKVTITII